MGAKKYIRADDAGCMVKDVAKEMGCSHACVSTTHRRALGKIAEALVKGLTGRFPSEEQIGEIIRSEMFQDVLIEVLKERPVWSREGDWRKEK